MTQPLHSIQRLVSHRNFILAMGKLLTLTKRPEVRMIGYSTDLSCA
ncbi:Uncharacterised protein [Vibrio cholerae]|nr:Uncharacterised protein [Vibrio cholerae]